MTALLHACDDLRYHLQCHANMEDPTDAQVQDYGLYLIDKLLSYTGKRIEEWTCMPQIQENWGQVFGNCLILEQWEYNTEGLAQLAAEHIATFTQDQSAAFEKITSAVSTQHWVRADLLPAWARGTGKTYLYNDAYHSTLLT